MAFTGKETSQYVEKKQLTEIRTNLEYLDTHTACISHDSYCPTQLETVYPTVRSTNCGSHYITYNGNEYGGDYYTDDGTVKSSHESGHNGKNYGTYESDNFLLYCNGDESTW